MALRRRRSRPAQLALRPRRGARRRGGHLPRPRRHRRPRARRLAADRRRRDAPGRSARSTTPPSSGTTARRRSRAPPTPATCSSRRSRSPGMLVLLRSRARLRPALLVDGIAAALAVSALSAAIVFQAVLEHAEGEPIAVATSLAYPLTDLDPAGRRRRRAGRDRLAPGPHLGAARRRHPRLLVRRLDVPRPDRRGHLRVRRLVRPRLVARPAADRGRRLAAPARRTDAAPRTTACA